MKNKKIFVTVFTLVILLALTTTTVFAGNPHFVGNIKVNRQGNSLTVSGKMAGLGNEPQVEILLSADAQCVNRGGKNPKAENKSSFSTSQVFPVQNGKANFTLTLTATFKPNCSPPMTVVFTNVVVTAMPFNISQTFPGPY